MRIRTVGGPYDGQFFEALDLQVHATILTIRSSGVARHFLSLPAPGDWPAVLIGAMLIHESEAHHYYELVSTPAGPTLEHDPGGERSRAAFAAATREMPDRDGAGAA